jgi:hypothetical protein
MKRWVGIFVTLLSMTVVLVPMTQAADEVAGRVVYHMQKAEMMEAGDVPDHIVGVAQQSGLTFFTKGPVSGQIATRMMNTHYDVVKGKGSYTTYIVDTFQDGSTIPVEREGLKERKGKALLRVSALARQKLVAIRTPTSPAPNGSNSNPVA